MGKIEIIGRLKENVRIDGIEYNCININLNKDFLIEFTRALLMKLEQGNTKIQYMKDFEDEIISEVEFEIVMERDKFKFTLSRDTFGDKILIGCEIDIIYSNDDIFGNVYDVKVKIIEFFNKSCENSKVFLLQDFNNEQICTTAYKEIYKVENRLRSILTRYLMKKYGDLLLSKSLKKEVDEYSKWFRKEVDGKYATFKRINTDYSNISFSKLLEALELKDTNIIAEDGESVDSKLVELKELAENDAPINNIRKKIGKIESTLKNRDYIFSDALNENNVDEIFNCFGRANFVNTRDLLIILDEEFKEQWNNGLSKMRNMVAHNKPICKELFSDIQGLCQWMHNKFNECDGFIENNFYSDETGVRSALEDMEVEKEIYESEYIEQQREAHGINFPLSEDSIESELAENCVGIKKLMDLISGFEDLKYFAEEIQAFIYEIEETYDTHKSITLQKKIQKIITEELGLELDEEGNTNLKMLVDKHIFQGIDFKNILLFYTENRDFLYSNFEYFDFNFRVSWYSISNKRYLISLDGFLSPENGGSDDLQFSLYIDDFLYKNYYLQINYGDYSIPVDGYIDDYQIKLLVDEIKEDVEETINTVYKIYNLTTKTMELLE